MYPSLSGENKLLLIDRPTQEYVPATRVPQEYLHLIIPYAGLYYEQDGDYEILSQHMNLGHFSLWMHDIFAQKDIVLCPYAPFRVLMLHFMCEDSLLPETYRMQDFRLEGQEYNLIDFHKEMFRVPMPTGKKVLSFHINILPDTLPDLAAHYPALQYLVNKASASTSGIINKKPYYMNAVCKLLIKNILTCKYVEEQAHYFLHRCCVDLFINFANQDTTANEPMLVSYVLNRETFHNIFTYLVEHPHKTHAAEDLALLFELPADALTAGFQYYFNTDIVSFMHMLKMMMVYNVMLQKSFTFSAIADTAGFKNVKAMIREIEEYYGCEVKLLRKVT